MSDERQTHELPPRRLRHRPKRHAITPLLGTGLGLFGALFFGLVGLELYQAKHSLQAVVVEKPVESRPSAQVPAHAQPKPNGNPKPIAGMESSPAVQTVSQPAAASRDKPASVSPKIASAGVKKVSQPLPPPATTKRTVLRHVVKKGETLYQLSRKYYGHQIGVKRIARYNGFSSEHQLTEGEVVYIPMNR
jgi:nucleoid-associated protein YgaU